MDEVSPISVIIFTAFVVFVIGLSFFLGKKAKSSKGYFAAGGTVPWGINGISFAGDYLSAASFLGICGMIALKGYDGFLYSIGYLAGWIVALFIVAEPMKRLGKYTFTDALDSKFGSRPLRLAAAISTLVVSIFYLIPQMVGAGVLVEPLLGLSHSTGVWIVGIVVILIVATAGMASTTYVQFLKGALLIVFSLVITVAMCVRGISTTPDHGGNITYEAREVISASIEGDILTPGDSAYSLKNFFIDDKIVKLQKGDEESYWSLEKSESGASLYRCQWLIEDKDDSANTIYNGKLESEGGKILKNEGRVEKIKGETDTETGPIGPMTFLSVLCDDETVIRVPEKVIISDSGKKVTVFVPKAITGNKFMRPGQKFPLEEDEETAKLREKEADDLSEEDKAKLGKTVWDKLNFVSLMLALFFGTAALPHILIRYYTVPSAACARKSTILAIAAIGFFYVLTMFLGLGATVNGALNPLSGNMSAPLLACTFGNVLFAIISAIAFATVLGTVSGLIVAASGAIAHDIADRFMHLKMTDGRKVLVGKFSAVAVGLIAIWLGIKFKGQNVSFLVGWAFSVAASANLPAIMMLLFWKKTTAMGITISIIVGIVSSLGLILLSPDMYKVYGTDSISLISLNQPGIISIPLSFLTLIIVSLMTQPKKKS